MADQQRPNVQIDGVVRPMTDAEYAEWLKHVADTANEA